MTIVRVGPTQKYSDGWEAAFGRKSEKSTAKRGTAKKSIRSAKKAGKKAARR